MVFNVTFNNISAISWQSVLLMEDTEVPGESHWPGASHWQTVSYKIVYRVHLAWAKFELTTLVVIGIDSIGNCKSNYHTITTTTTLWKSENVEIITLYMYITLLILLNLCCLLLYWTFWIVYIKCYACID
jgi:hypothetical protein